MVSHFLGITAFVNNFDMMVKDVHHKGDAYAAGLTYGYAWVLGDHWNIEATAGVGVLRYRQFKYDRVLRNRVRSTIVRPPLHLSNWGYPLFILFDNEH